MSTARRLPCLHVEIGHSKIRIAFLAVCSSVNFLKIYNSCFEIAKFKIQKDSIH